MSAVATPTRPKTAKTKPATHQPSSVEREFMQGRDWAISCLSEAQSFRDHQSGESHRLRWVRKGEAQDNFVLGWAAECVGGPPALKNHALRGFCAVMSDYLANPAGPILSHAYQLPFAEFHGGEVGADGTRPTPPEMLEDAAGAQIATRSAQPSTRWAINALDAVETKIDQAQHVMQNWAEHASSSAAWGLLRLVETLKPSIAEYSAAADLGDPESGALQDLCGDIDNVAEVARLVNEELDDLTLHAVVSLLRLAVSIAEEACDAEHQERANG